MARDNRIDGILKCCYTVSSMEKSNTETLLFLFIIIVGGYNVVKNLFFSIDTKWIYNNVFVKNSQIITTTVVVHNDFSFTKQKLLYTIYITILSANDQDMNLSLRIWIFDSLFWPLFPATSKQNLQLMKLLWKKNASQSKAQ